jgi:hypothetical protein
MELGYDHRIQDLDSVVPQLVVVTQTQVKHRVDERREGDLVSLRPMLERVVELSWGSTDPITSNHTRLR